MFDYYSVAQWTSEVEAATLVRQHGVCAVAGTAVGVAGMGAVVEPADAGKGDVAGCY